MDANLYIVERLIGIGIPLFIVLDVFFLMPKRIRMLEASADPRDVKKLQRLRWGLDVMKLRWFAGFMAVSIVAALIIEFF